MNTWNVTNCLWFTIVSKRTHFFILSLPFNNYPVCVSRFSVVVAIIWNVSFSLLVCQHANKYYVCVKREMRVTRISLSLSPVYAWLIPTAKRTIIVINFKALRWNKVTFLINTIIFITQKKILSFHIAVNNVFKWISLCKWNKLRIRFLFMERKFLWHF